MRVRAQGVPEGSRIGSGSASRVVNGARGVLKVHKWGTGVPIGSLLGPMVYINV